MNALSFPWVWQRENVLLVFSFEGEIRRESKGFYCHILRQGWTPFSRASVAGKENLQTIREGENRDEELLHERKKKMSRSSFEGRRR